MFPEQRDTLARVAAVAADAYARNPRTLFVVGTYTIGKVLACAAAIPSCGAGEGV